MVGVLFVETKWVRDPARLDDHKWHSSAGMACRLEAGLHETGT